MRAAIENLRPSQLLELKKFSGGICKFGLNFAVCNVHGEVILLCEGGKFRSDTQCLMEISRQVLSQNSEPSEQTMSLHGNGSGSGGTGVNVFRFDRENQILAVVLKRKSGAVGTALVDLGNNVLQIMDGEKKDMTGPVFSEMLELLAGNFQIGVDAEQQIEKISMELAHTYEELVLLHNISTNMKVTEQDANFLQMACDSLTDIVCVEGIAILLEKAVEGEKKLVISAGSGLINIDDYMAAILHSRLVEEINKGNEALLDSAVYFPFKYDWPGNIRNIMAVPLCSKEKRESHFAQETKAGSYVIGLMVAINRIDKADFDSTDVKLFNSVAGECAVFIENGALFKDLKELFIGSLKALTSSIDAKDKYTHGHSERVAFISRWIAERFAEIEPLDQEHIHKIYLAGLLHDIGKIGIDESVLRKQGKLTAEEREHIRRHPSIGAGILEAIKQMRDIVPGVLCHHERIDGKGYPQGLMGEHIPLAGKVVGLADSFDGMTSKRVYRDAMTVEEALDEIKKGLGTQFDEKIGRLFLKSDVYMLWDIIQNGFSDNYGSFDFSEYGTAAVGVLIR
jgi:HD-GYP domain-containing protein (c-di-GMP phosphodiesterase class II)